MPLASEMQAPWAVLTAPGSAAVLAGAIYVLVVVVVYPCGASLPAQVNLRCIWTVNKSCQQPGCRHQS